MTPDFYLISTDGYGRKISYQVSSNDEIMLQFFGGRESWNQVQGILKLFDTVFRDDAVDLVRRWQCQKTVRGFELGVRFVEDVHGRGEE